MPKGHHGPPKKYDLGHAKSLYLSGMSRNEILKLPEFAAISPKYFDKIRWQERWAEERKSVVVASQHLAEGMPIRETITDRAKEIKEHTDFMWKELRRERDIYTLTPKANGFKAQLNRLNNLEKYNDLAVSALGMDKNGVGGDHHAAGLAFLSAIHTAPEGSQALLAVINLKPKENALQEPIRAEKQVSGKEAETILEEQDGEHEEGGEDQGENEGA